MELVSLGGELVERLFYSEPGDDSGLRDPATGKKNRGGGARRPVYKSWTEFRYLDKP